jgi:hypothetical protein
VRVAVELLIDTGRRPVEVCQLPFNCLDRDGEGKHMLIYDDFKNDKPGRRLPIADATAALIIEQQKSVQRRYPATKPAELKLLPPVCRNPYGRRAMTYRHLANMHRDWIDTLPPLLQSDNSEYDKTQIVLYVHRHTYAQRHADAGVPVDVLRDLMGHDAISSTQVYYRISENRRRAAIDRVAVHQFDRHGNRVWRQAQALLDHEHVRRSLGEVSVPYGVCHEPSNVAAGGGACPFRFRCVGCDHFRTDVSYLPDLKAYLHDLLRDRERVLAAVDVDDWARTEALPSENEIGHVKALIRRVEEHVDQLTLDERAEITQATAMLRRARQVVGLGMPHIRTPEPNLRLERP